MKTERGNFSYPARDSPRNKYEGACQDTLPLVRTRIASVTYLYFAQGNERDENIFARFYGNIALSLCIEFFVPTRKGEELAKFNEIAIRDIIIAR